MMKGRGLLGLAFFCVVASGCFGSDFTFEMEASDASIIGGGYSYNGRAVRSADGSMAAQLHDEQNTGLVTADVTDGDGTRWRVVFNDFSGTADKQGGGVRQAFFEHGDTGNGSTELPKFFAHVAAWGTATLSRDGTAVREPNTLGTDFTAHLMVVRGKVRDPTTHVIAKSDGTTPYDPADPTDGFVHTEGGQAILQLKTRSGAFFMHFQFDDVRISTNELPS